MRPWRASLAAGMGSDPHHKGFWPLGNCDGKGWRSSALRPHIPGCWPDQPATRRPHPGEGSSSPPETWALDSAWSQQRPPPWSRGSLMGYMGLQTLLKPEFSFQLCHDCWQRHLFLCPQSLHLWGGPSWDPFCFKLHLLLPLHWPGVQIPSSFSFFPKAAPDLAFHL